MQILPASCPASLPALFFLLIPLSALCASIDDPTHAPPAPSSHLIPDPETPLQPSGLPLSTPSPATNRSSPKITSPTPPPHHLRLLDFRAIVTSPVTEFNLIKALERTLEAFAYCLLDLDLLEQQHFEIRFGDFTLDLYDVAEQLNMLAVKAVLMNLLHMVEKGFLGLLVGEVLDVHAEVRLIFALGVVGGQYED